MPGRARSFPTGRPAAVALGTFLSGALALAAVSPAARAARIETGDSLKGGLREMASAVAAAEASLASGELQVAESRYRSAAFAGWMLLGRLETEAGEPLRARSAFEHAATTVVDARPARIALAMVLVELGETDQAELVLRTLVSDDPSDHEARRLLSSALAEGGRLDEAVQELEQLRYLTPDDPEHAYLLATAYLRQDRQPEAEALLDEIAAALPTAKTHVLIGRTYRDADRFELARRAFERALELDPEVERAHYYLGTVHLLEQGVNALADAARELEAELRIRPGDEMTNLYLGMALVEDRRYAEAIEPLRIAAERDDVRADALRFLGRALIETGRADDGIAALREGLAAARADLPEGVAPGEFSARQLSSLHYQLGQALRAAGERQQADVHFAEAKRYQARSAESARESLARYLSDEIDAGRPRPTGADGPAPADRAELATMREQLETSLASVYMNLGVMRAREGEHLRAARLFERAEAIEPELPGLQYALGVARFNGGRFQQAAEALGRALEAGDQPSGSGPGPGSSGGPVLEMLALAWLNAGEHAKAADLLAEIPEPSLTRGLRYAQGVALIRAGRAEQVSAVFERLLRDDAEWPELNVLLGQAHAQQGDFDGAVASLHRALALDPRVAEAHGTLAEIHLRRGELDDAERELRAELAIRPRDSRTRLTLATVLDLAQRPGQAIEVLRPLLADHPDLARGRALLGKILLATGDVEAAREQLEAAVRLAPEDAESRYQLGQAYQKLGRGEDAQREFEAFRRLKDERRAPAAAGPGTDGGAAP